MKYTFSVEELEQLMLCIEAVQKATNNQKLGVVKMKVRENLVDLRNKNEAKKNIGKGLNDDLY